jgi:hypothetical protein
MSIESLNNFLAAIRQQAQNAGHPATHGDALIDAGEYYNVNGTFWDVFDMIYDEDHIKGNSLSESHYYATDTSGLLLFQKQNGTDDSTDTFLIYDMNNNTMTETTDRAAVTSALDAMDGNADGNLSDVNGNPLNITSNRLAYDEHLSFEIGKDGFTVSGMDDGDWSSMFGG